MATMSNLSFRTMKLMLVVRDIFMSPRALLEEAHITPGLCVLDYGCGPGSYSIAAAELVGGSGKVYALDIHPLAIQSVQSSALKKGLKNIETISSNCATGLSDQSVDVVLLYDILHGLKNHREILEELSRVLKPGGTLSISDHHLKEEKIMSRLGDQERFELSGKGKWTYRFLKK